MAVENHGASNEERDRVRCRCCGIRWEEHDPDPDRTPCIRHGIVPMQAAILRLEAEVAAQKLAIATLKGCPPARTAGEIAAGAPLVAAHVRPPAPAPAGKVLGMDLREDWLPTPDDAGVRRYPDGSKITGYLGHYIVEDPAGHVETISTGCYRLFSTPEDAAGHLASFGLGPKGSPSRSDFKEDWLPTPDDAGYYRYEDGSFIRPSRRFPGEWTVGGDVEGGVLLPSFESPEAAAEHMMSLGVGPAAGRERSVDDGRRGEGRGEGRGAGVLGRGRDGGG